jgi:hypothetical protein
MPAKLKLFDTYKFDNGQYTMNQTEVELRFREVPMRNILKCSVSSKYDG